MKPARKDGRMAAWPVLEFAKEAEVGARGVGLGGILRVYFCLYLMMPLEDLEFII